jgi:hypothetical protein
LLHGCYRLSRERGSPADSARLRIHPDPIVLPLVVDPAQEQVLVAGGGFRRSAPEGPGGNVSRSRLPPLCSGCRLEDGKGLPTLAIPRKFYATQVQSTAAQDVERPAPSPAPTSSDVQLLRR